MSEDVFQEEEDFRDIPDEVVEGQQAPAVSIRMQRPVAPAQLQNQQQQPIQKTIVEEYEENPQLDTTPDEEEDYSDIMSDARIRLAQGQLYEIIMNHELFAGVEADEKAVKIVQKEIRNFAKERMEIMLGMRQEQKEVSVNVASPFNALEVETLKALASAATKGASRSEEAEQYVPVVRTTGLNPITTRKAAPKPAQPKPLAKSPSNPVKRVKVDPNVEYELQQDGVERIYIEEAKRQIANDTYKPLTKPIHEMTEDEIRARNKQASTRGSTVKNPNALPMPSVEQEEMLYSQRAQAANQNPQMQSIMAILTKKK